MSFSEQEVEEFRIEAVELLESAEKSLLSLDRGGSFRDAFDNVFRCFHNLKGGAGMMDLAKVEHHVHELETSLMQFKTGDSLPPDYVNYFLLGIDATKVLLEGGETDFVHGAIAAPAAPATSAGAESGVAAKSPDSGTEAATITASVPSAATPATALAESPAEAIPAATESEVLGPAPLPDTVLESSFGSGATEKTAAVAIEAAPTFAQIPDPVAPVEKFDSALDKLFAEDAALGLDSGDEFILECEEILERVSRCLQLIEKGQHKKSTIEALYRDVHSLKGSAYLFSHTLLGDVGHAIESSLDGVREGKLLPSQSLLNALFKSIGLIEGLVRDIKNKTKSAGLENEVKGLVRELESAASAPAIAATPRMDSMTAPAPAAKSANAHVASENAMASRSPLPAPAASPPSVQSNASGDNSDSSGAGSKDPEASGSIRVPVALLDSLMTLMGEMVLVRNQVLQYSSASEDLEFLNLSKRLNVVTSEIQGEMMKTRMQPIGNVLGKFNRVVRDLSQELQKQINLVSTGAETELDKSLLEAIKDPLNHIVRNSCDHGIENPETRRKSGKPEAGTIHVRSYHEGGQVIIEVSDDGRGLHRDVILAKAIEKGLVPAEKGAKLSEKEVFNLIFAPGFSTAAKITNVSGRGVGMDVVRSNIERIGGTVDIASVAGSGTTIRLKIPLTLAIVPALIVKCGGNTFAIPQVKLEELVRVDQENAENKVECLHGAPVLRLRGNILPLVNLRKILKVPEAAATGIINIAVVNAEQCSFGLIIDEIQDTADIVVKPLTRLLKSLQVFSGATILGNGAVALILDVLGVSKVAQVGAEKSLQDEAAAMGGETASLEAQDFLLVNLKSPTRHAIVLGYVHRLEIFKKSAVEFSGAMPVIRYRDVILPLISASEQLGYGKPSDFPETIPVVVIQKAGELYGIIVEGIHDTLRTSVQLSVPVVKQPGLFGSLNTETQLIVVVDPFELIAKAFPEPGFEVETTAPAAAPARARRTEGAASRDVDLGDAPKRRVLLVEDTVFFRKAIKGLLEKTGYEVSTANDGKEALNLLAKAEADFDIVVSDIEMPNLNGFQLAAAIRGNPKLRDIPLLAVSSRADAKSQNEGKRVGFDMYLEKLKPAILISAVDALVDRRKESA